MNIVSIFQNQLLGKRKQAELKLLFRMPPGARLPDILGQ
jgi:hypothetical protein